ncbi:unnamed protein product [Closterium sp. NIES-64]|nr:unnamed protein product [Closterium sp. NIES-64]
MSGMYLGAGAAMSLMPAVAAGEAPWGGPAAVFRWSAGLGLMWVVLWVRLFSKDPPGGGGMGRGSGGGGGGSAGDGNPLSPRLPGSPVMGISNTAGTLAGIVGVAATGLILQAWATDIEFGWWLAFVTPAGLCVLSAAIFCAFATGERLFD